MRHRSRPRWSIQGKRDEDLEAPEVSAAWQSDHAHVLLLVSHPRAQLFGWGDAVLISVLRRSLGLLIAVAAAARHFAIPPWSLSPNQPKLFDYRRVCRWSCGNKKKGGPIRVLYLQRELLEKFRCCLLFFFCWVQETVFARVVGSSPVRFTARSATEVCVPPIAASVADRGYLLLL